VVKYGISNLTLIPMLPPKIPPYRPTQSLCDA
jgi:hypothetical protein